MRGVAFGPVSKDPNRMMEEDDNGAFRLIPERDGGTIQLLAIGREPQDAIQAGLRGLLELALLGSGDDMAAAGQGTASVPINGRGPSLGAAFERIATDLLGQLDDHGAGFAHVRIDGILTADDGGYSAWGYLVGATGHPPPDPLELAGRPIVERDAEDRVLVRCELRRQEHR
jgi:hypothetical protein